ncbi:unnamed protein product [Macrosiphum euphorbiae]|uniref:HAT C-terminal dimerisation domain-containing protein n=1 Tax=Macrosiphum euphorbiae TaxID=13131 RepID=A0AAV0Y8F9_9HEMI|nr:unnamed protein product [Macrosiphum euphorbiae]
MTSVIRGAVQHIQKSCVNAVHSPCSNHALNLSISKSSNVQLVRNSMGIIKEVLSFFNLSSKRNFILKNNLRGQKRSITSLCETRWIERHDSIFEFQTNLKEIVDSLINISEWDDHVSSSKAKTLIFSICNCEFIVTLFTVTSILSITSAASKLLQSVTQDVASATNCINDIIKTLNDKRTNCDVQFKKVFEESKNVMTELDVEIKQPRIVKKQNQRCNTPANSIEEYYRRILFIPIIDNVLEDIRYRFLNDKNKTISLLMQLIPSNTIKMSSETSDELIQTVGDQYAFLNFNTFMFRGELELWKTKWTTQKNEGLNIPNEVFSAFDECSNIFFPSIKKLLLVLGTLPVSVATAERSFSTLRRLKTWIRSEMGQSRLTGLALLHIHRQLPLNVDKIIDRFAKNKRCLDFVI